MRKKTTFLATAVAAISAGLMGATMAPNVIQANANAQEQVAQQSKLPAPEQQQQSGSINNIKMAAAELSDYGKKLPVGHTGFSRPYHKWCSQPGRGGFNKIKHSRNKRRKHRRK